MRFSAPACLAWLCFSLVACESEKTVQRQEDTLPPPLVSVITMEAADVPLFSTFMGQTAGFRSAAVKPQVTGILQERLFEEGARVEQGTPMFRIDPAPFKAALEQAQGQLASAKSQLENARRENMRVQRLYKSNAVSQQERDSARAAFLSAKAEAESARAAVDEARIRLGYTKVYAPISGWTSREVSTVGSLVSPESTLTYITQNDPMDVHFAVPSVELLAMRDMEARGRARSYGQGSPVSLRLLQGMDYAIAGEVVFLDTQVDTSTSAVRAKARFPNPQGILLPGEYATVQVGGASLVKALMLPQEAVVQTENGPCVYALDADDRAVLKAVELGPAFGGEFLVERGLESGQRVIVLGQDKVKPGKKVQTQMLIRGGKEKSGEQRRELEMSGMSSRPESNSIEDTPAPVFEKSNLPGAPSEKGAAR